MSEQFKVGAVCITQNLLTCPERNGQEVTIFEGLEERDWWLISTGQEGRSLAYLVQWLDGEITTQEPHELRKKQPPSTDTGEVRIRELFNQPPVATPATQPEEVVA